MFSLFIPYFGEDTEHNRSLNGTFFFWIAYCLFYFCLYLIFHKFITKLFTSLFIFAILKNKQALSSVQLLNTPQVDFGCVHACIHVPWVQSLTLSTLMSDFFHIRRKNFLCFKCQVGRHFVFNLGTADVIWIVLKHVYLQKSQESDLKLLKMASCHLKLDLKSKLLFTQVSHSLATDLSPIVVN